MKTSPEKQRLGIMCVLLLWCAVLIAYAAFIYPGLHPSPIPVTLIFGVGLIVGYLAIRVAAVPAATEQNTAAIPVAQEVPTP